MASKVVTYYRDFYGSTASITEYSTGSAKLVIRCGAKIVVSKKYDSIRGAKIALGRASEYWSKVN